MVADDSHFFTRTTTTSTTTYLSTLVLYSLLLLLLRSSLLIMLSEEILYRYVEISNIACVFQLNSHLVFKFAEPGLQVLLKEESNQPFCYELKLETPTKKANIIR